MTKRITVEGFVEHASAGWCKNCTVAHSVLRLRLVGRSDIIVINVALRIDQGERIRAINCESVQTKPHNELCLLPERLEVLDENGNINFVWMEQIT